MPPSRPSLTPLNLFILLFALSAVLGVWPAYDPNLSSVTLTFILSSVVLYFIIAYAARSRSAIHAVAIVTLLIITAFALYFITQYGHQDYPGKGGIIARLGQLTTLLPDLQGFGPHPNGAATFLEIAVPLGIALTLSTRKTTSKVVWAICTLLVSYAIFLSASRGAWLALAAMAGIALALVILARLPRRTATILIGIGLAGTVASLLAIIILGPERLPFLASTFSRATDRGQLFQGSLSLAQDYTFSGAGLGNTFSMVYSRYRLLLQVPFLNYAHNLPLSVWLNQGMPGLIALIGIIAAFYLFVYRVIRTTQPSLIFHGAWLSVTTILLHGITDAPQYADSPWVMPMIFISLGLTVSSGVLALNETPQRLTVRVRSFARPIWVASAIAIVTFIVIFNKPLRAAWSTNLGAVDETRAELAPDLTSAQRDELYQSAQTHYRDALRIEANHPNANRRLGNLLVNLQQFDTAVPALEAAFETELTNITTIKGLGLAYTWVGRSADAARMFLLLDDPVTMSNELYTWGNYRGEQDQPLLSAYAFETAQTMYPSSDNTDIWLLIADLYHAADHSDAARIWYNRVVDIAPGNQRALDGLATLGN